MGTVMYAFNNFGPLPDFNNYDKTSIKETLDRARNINEEAKRCLKLLAENIETYVDVADSVHSAVLDGIIPSVKDVAFDQLVAMYDFIAAQFDQLEHRYDEVENNAHIGDYVHVALIKLDGDNLLGIYNPNLCANRPEFIRTDAAYILEQKQLSKNNKGTGTTDKNLKQAMEEARAVAAAAKVIRTEQEDDNSQFKFVKSDKTFEDVAGLHELKEDLWQLVDMIKDPEKYKKFGAYLPKGTILYGPPGTGKTLLAKAIAGEAGVNFIATCATDFTASKWGVVPKMLNELFETARENAPCIVFMDEIDSLGQKRGMDSGNSLAHKEGLNSLLSKFGGFNDYDGVHVIAATNRLEDLDPALTRPGRFDNKFSVPLPNNVDEVEEVVNIYMKNKYFDENLTSRKIAHKLLGQSPASIESILNDACLLAIRHNEGVIREEDLNISISKKAIKGHIRPFDKDSKDNKMVAVHEAGHALVAVLNGIIVRDVSILPSTTGAGGLTTMEPQDKHYFKKSDFVARIMVAYAGRAAEELAFGAENITTGAYSDIKKATNLIKDASSNYGFDMCDTTKHAPMVYTSIKQSNIEKAANKYYLETVNVLKENYEALYDIAKELVENGTITGDKVNAIVEKHSEKEIENEC